MSGYFSKVLEAAAALAKGSRSKRSFVVQFGGQAAKAFSSKKEANKFASALRSTSTGKGRAISVRKVRV